MQIPLIEDSPFNDKSIIKSYVLFFITDYKPIKSITVGCISNSAFLQTFLEEQIMLTDALCQHKNIE